MKDERSLPPSSEEAFNTEIGDDIEGIAARERALNIASPVGNDESSDPLAFNDFRNFVYLLWHELGLPDPTSVQYEIANFLQHGPKRRMVLAFRGVAKTWLTGAYVLWRLHRNPLLQILVVSASADHAKSVTSFILKCIIEVPWLRHLMPDEKKGHKTSTVNFDVNGCKVSVQPSVRARGITGQLPGNRADIIIGDDLEIPKNSDTVGKRELLHKGMAEFASILKPGGETVILGTYQSEESIYKDLPAKGYRLFVVPARYPDAEQRKVYGDTLADFVADALDSGKARPGDPVEPTRFPEEELLEREMEMGRSNFALQFMLMPTLLSELLYPLRLRDLIVLSLTPTHAPRTVLWSGGVESRRTDLPNVGFKSDSYNKPAMYTKDLWDPWDAKHMFIDPAGKGQDEIAYSITGKLGGKIGLLDCDGRLGGYDDNNLVWLSERAIEYEVGTITIEDNFGGGMFAKLFRPVLVKTAEKHNKPAPIIEEVHSTGQKEKRIIDTLEPIMNQHRLVVHDALVTKDYESVMDRSPDKQHLYRLFYQMTRLTKERNSLKHDDRIETVAGSTAYWLDKISEDVDSNRRDREFDEAVERLQSIGLDRPTSTNWNDSYTTTTTGGIR
ncbi:phage terminase large subunit [Enhydrobacter aerosaccus]|uniref:phage terminase large subunit n=1 Tax=Enhydrobacter aerosaccus TaxID=225324 RepID=UPI000A2F01B2|nr:phage terminase large subunit [Enhydrobacter aerosaccus]